MKARATAAARISSAFGDIIALLMGSAQFKHYALVDLEWLVIPPLVSGQFLLAHAQSRETGLAAPAATILWGSVSAEVDQRLTATIDQPLRLKPHEWQSGDILWIVAAAGEPRADGDPVS